MTRVVGGSARGVRLKVPDDGTRPTSDRAREAIFSSLESMRGPWIDANVLDLYAGSGACGLEAASRGAARVDLVESDRRAVTVIEYNRKSVLAAGAPGAVGVHRAKAEQWVISISNAAQLNPAQYNEAQYNVVFCDPPYATDAGDIAAVLEALARAEALAPDALMVLERSARDPEWQWPRPFSARWDRRYGEAHLWIAAIE